MVENTVDTCMYCGSQSLREFKKEDIKVYCTRCNKELEGLSKLRTLERDMVNQILDEALNHHVCILQLIGAMNQSYPRYNQLRKTKYKFIFSDTIIDVLQRNRINLDLDINQKTLYNIPIEIIRSDDPVIAIKIINDGEK